MTGKLDVRVAAAAPPETSEAPEPLDEPSDNEHLKRAIDGTNNEAIAA